jgi:hypothetical protein
VCGVWKSSSSQFKKRPPFDQNFLLGCFDSSQKMSLGITPDSVIDPVLLLMDQILMPPDNFKIDSELDSIGRRGTSPLPDEDNKDNSQDPVNLSATSRDSSTDLFTTMTMTGASISEMCRQLKKRKGLSPESEAELDVYSVCTSYLLFIVY